MIKLIFACVFCFNTNLAFSNAESVSSDNLNQLDKKVTVLEGQIVSMKREQTTIMDLTIKWGTLVVTLLVVIFGIGAWRSSNLATSTASAEFNNSFVRYKEVIENIIGDASKKLAEIDGLIELIKQKSQQNGNN